MYWHTLSQSHSEENDLKHEQMLSPGLGRVLQNGIKYSPSHNQPEFE